MCGSSSQRYQTTSVKSWGVWLPLMALGRWNIYAQGLIYLITQHDKTHYRKTELAGVAVYFSWVLAVAYAQPTWAEKVAWVMVSHAVAGVLHVQIVLSHWSMHSYEGRAYTGADDEWYITTMRTTMNVATPPPLDFMHIGLQFQVEHHLFPHICHVHYPDISPIVRKTAEEFGLPYRADTSFWEALKLHTAQLRQLGRA